MRIWDGSFGGGDFLNHDEYVIEVITKEDKLYQKEIEGCGFHIHAKMMRISNPDVSGIFSGQYEIIKYFSEGIGRRAVEKDTSMIHKMLSDIFDSRIGHLPTLEETRDRIKDGQFYVAENADGQIALILQRVVAPKSFYINQIYNGLRKNDIHAVLLNELKKYTDNGGKYVYAWVDEKNIASLKFHKKYGLQHDGIWDIVYINGT